MNIPKKKSIILLHGVFQPNIFDALSKRKIEEVFVMEGRPSLESSRNICRELLKRKIKPAIIADNMAGFLFYKNLVKEIWISYQSLDKDGALCPIGGLVLSVLGKNHKVPVRLYLNPEKLLLIGKSKEILSFNGIRVAPRGVKGYVPLVEWIPKKYIGEIYE